ncbi:MAG: SdrD B-like domain-containing protein [Tepidisphaeraceae bacterium]
MGRSVSRSVSSNQTHAFVETLERRALFSSASLDPAFGSSGVTYAGVFGITATTIYEDGRILAMAHSSFSFVSENVEFVRFMANGTRDASFGMNGRVVTTFADHVDLYDHGLSAVAIQPDGKIVAGGWVAVRPSSTQRFALARYNADGTPDLTFGTGGYIVELGDHAASFCTTLTIQPDGRILAAGTRYEGGPDFVLHRYNSDGSTDTSFGSRSANGVRTGRVSFDVFGFDDHAEDIALQPDGAILVGGRSQIIRQSNYRYAYTVVRFTPSGDLDRTFAGINDEGWHNADLALAPDGSILVGYREFERVRLAQYEPTTGVPRARATLHVEEGQDARRTIDLAVTPAQDVVVIANDGKNWLQARFIFQNGAIAPDATFGNGGWQSTDFGPNQPLPPGSISAGAGEYADTAGTILVQPDGGVVISGTAVVQAGGTTPVLARFLDSANVAGNVFSDVIADGARGAGDYGKAGFRLFIDRDNDGICDKNESQTRTSVSGRYTFADLPAGAYWVRVTPVDGWRATTNLAYKVVVPIGGSVTRHFGVTRNVLITGTVFMDANKDGGKDAAEPGLSAWRVFVDADGDGVLDDDETSVLTDATGRYAIGTLAGGTHQIRVVQQTGYRRTSPAAGYRAVSLFPGTIATKVNFGEKRIA